MIIGAADVVTVPYIREETLCMICPIFQMSQCGMVAGHSDTDFLCPGGTYYPPL